MDDGERKEMLLSKCVKEERKVNEKSDLNVCDENNEVKSVTTGDGLMVTLENNTQILL